MAGCPSCGADLPAGARFCAFCGTAIHAPASVSEERRTVTILFVDLVGFTERSDRADPEDVRRTLVPFHAKVKADIERFGGTLDKFIGDAALGVFGAPVAHEDDPLRAVHAALAIVSSMEELRRTDPAVAVRVAVNTGEAVVAFGTGPQVGEAVAGDVVNTASRMQSLAPRNAVVIGPATLRAVRGRFDVEAMPPATVKGKAEPLQIWRVLGERTEPEPETLRTRFVGRERELATLIGLFDEVERSGSRRVVTIGAEAGVGKSRLVAELAVALGERARWLSGACLPYGEGVTLAPLRQTVRTLAGVAPSDDAGAVLAGLQALAARVEPDPRERRWLVRTLETVLALDAEGPAVGTEEIAQAWARVLGAAAHERPVLLAIEDLHDAAPAFVEVLGSTAELLAEHPVLLAVTARPGLELSEPLAGGSPLTLGPLGEAETRELIGSMLEERVVSGSVLERAAGNPLYAIEFARMLAESGDEAATPESVQAVIAARLDMVPVEVRQLALDASVLGDEVWPDALARLGERGSGPVREGVEELERRGLLERRPSSLPGVEAFGFTHALIREVAYGRLPRAGRARRHLDAARWLEETVAARAEGWAEGLARHYASAAELATAAGDPEVAEQASEPALRWLLVAGERAMRVDPAAAFEALERALALAPPGTRQREEALWRSANAARRSGRLDAAEVLERQEEALAIARDRGDQTAVGEALTRIGSQRAVTGDVAGSRAALAEAVATLELLPPGQALARAYAYRAEEELFAGDTEDAVAFADRALALVADDETQIVALHVRGDARCSMGELAAGLEDLDQALRMAEEGGRVGDVITSRSYLAEWRWATEGPRAGLAEWETALELAERRNVHSQATYAKGAALWVLLEAGEWDRVLDRSDELLSLPEGRVDLAVTIVARVARGHVLLARGRRAEVGDPADLLSLTERTQELAVLAPALVLAAEVALADGDVATAVARLERFEQVTDGVAPEYRAVGLVRAVRLALACGRRDLAERLAAGARPHALRDRLRLEAASAMLAEAHGEIDAAEAYARLADRLRDYGDPFEEAMALLGVARTAGDGGAAERGRAILARLGAVR